MALTSVVAALEIVSKVSKALDALRERAKTSKDAGLKEDISKLWDDFLDLKAIISRLTDENADLKQQIAKGAEKPPKPEIRQIGRTNHYYVSDQGPFCQPCYDVKGKLIPLTPQQRYGSAISRKCEVCKAQFIESDAPPLENRQTRPYWE